MAPGGGVRTQDELGAVHRRHLNVVPKRAVQELLEHGVQGQAALVLVHQSGENAAFVVEQMSDVFWTAFQDRGPWRGCVAV